MATTVNQNIQPGRVAFGATPGEYSTAISSGVAVCLYHSTGGGGIANYLMPSYTGDKDPSAKFGNVALEQLLDGLRSAGFSSGLKAKIFGGAGEGSGRRRLGDDNVEAARTFLSNNGIPIVTEEVGGSTNRLIRFKTEDGSVAVKQLAA